MSQRTAVQRTDIRPREILFILNDDEFECRVRVEAVDKTEEAEALEGWHYTKFPTSHPIDLFLHSQMFASFAGWPMLPGPTEEETEADVPRAKAKRAAPQDRAAPRKR